MGVGLADRRPEFEPSVRRGRGRHAEVSRPGLCGIRLLRQVVSTGQRVSGEAAAVLVGRQEERLGARARENERYDFDLSSGEATR